MVELTRRQKWNNYIALLFALIGFASGLNLRNSTLYATSFYKNAEVGIEAQYPQNWLIDFDGDYIFRVRDLKNIGYKTTIQVSTQTLGANISNRNVFDAINLKRYSILAAYKVLSIDDNFSFPSGIQAAAMRYAYAESGNTNASLQDLPVIVRGIDILVIQGGQAIVITFLADSNVFEGEYFVLENFLANLKF